MNTKIMKKALILLTFLAVHICSNAQVFPVYFADVLEEDGKEILHFEWRPDYISYDKAVITDHKGELVAELKEAERAREDSELSPEGFAVFWYLRREGIAGAEKIAREVEETLGKLPHWERDAAQERKLRRRMYKIMIDAGVDKVVELVDKLLRMLRRSG